MTSPPSALAVGPVLLALGLGAVLAGCSAEGDDPGPSTDASSASASPTPGASPSGTPDASASKSLAPEASPSSESSGDPAGDPAGEPRAVRPDDLRLATAAAAVRHLAGRIGARHATSPAYRRAVTWVAGELRGQGYDVRREPVAVPAGDSWGVPVAAGRSWNVVATPAGFDATEPHLVVGAHLDTVAVAPGAEDNASGVAVLLAAADAAADRRTRLPVVWIAFGAEEPRGPSDDDHHYGSRAHVAALRPAERRAVRAMVSLDRVGVGAVVPVGSAGEQDPVQRDLLDAARRAGVPVVAEALSRSSDHWSYVRAGLPAARLGSTPYAAYHSADDVPSVVQPEQLRRTARLLLAWLAPR